jgi:hypothetical protein
VEAVLTQVGKLKNRIPNVLYKEDKMSGNTNKDIPAQMKTTILDDKYIREFDRMIQDTREFMREYNERRRLRGL